MSGVLTPEERTRMVKELRGRILNVLSAASYQMDQFLSLVDLVLSESTQTAAMEIGPQPILHLNEKFVKKYCRRDEHLMLLVMHELYHLILGHTRLFSRATRAHNIVFDAVINAQLCQQFRDGVYVEFFQKLNPAGQFPGRILRPPKGWPHRLDIVKDASENEKKVMELLYGEKTGTVTYHEIMQLLESELGGEGTGEATLLGDHSGEAGEGIGDTQAVADEVVTGVLREVTKGWPDSANLGKGRSPDGKIQDWLAPNAKNPRSEFLKALYALLRKASVLPADPRTPYAWKLVSSPLGSQTVMPDLRDRLAEGRRELYGGAPLFYNTEVLSSRRRWMPRDTTHVYIDVSGSMDSELPWLVGALDPLVRRGVCRVFAFSTVVSEVSRRKGFGEKFENTNGTEINCVLEHLCGMADRVTPGKVVILTDGMVGSPKPQLIQEIKRRKVKFYVGLVGYALMNDLAFADVVERLPKFR